MNVRQLGALIGAISAVVGIAAGGISHSTDWSQWRERIEVSLSYAARESFSSNEAHVLRRELSRELQGWVREQYPVSQAVISRRLDDYERQIAEIRQRLRPRDNNR